MGATPDVNSAHITPGTFRQDQPAPTDRPHPTNAPSHRTATPQRRAEPPTRNQLPDNTCSTESGAAVLSRKPAPAADPDHHTQNQIHNPHRYQNMSTKTANRKNTPNEQQVPHSPQNRQFGRQTPFHVRVFGAVATTTPWAQTPQTIHPYPWTTTSRKSLPTATSCNQSPALSETTPTSEP